MAKAKVREIQTAAESTPTPKNDKAASERGFLRRCLAEMCDGDILALADFARAVENNRGNARTPVEDALVWMAWNYRRGLEAAARGEDACTIDHLRRVIDDHQEWFDEALWIARHVNRNYPAALAEAEKADSAET